MTVPQIAQLPDPPRRTDAQADFSLKADGFLGALPKLATETNTVSLFVNGRAVSASESAAAAAQSALAAANSATAAAQHRDKAALWADSADEVEPGRRSAAFHAAAAAGSATSAASSGDDAASSKAAAANSATAAAQHRDKAALWADSADEVEPGRRSAAFHAAAAAATAEEVDQKLASIASGPVASVVGLGGAVTLEQLEEAGVATGEALAAEVTARQQADAALQAALTAETSARQQALAAEVTARQQADAALATAMRAEDVVIISTSTQAERGRCYVLTASLTLTLPENPAAGDVVRVVNQSGSRAAVVARNGRPIMGLAEDMVIDALNASVELMYADATRGWVLI